MGGLRKDEYKYACAEEEEDDDDDVEETRQSVSDSLLIKMLKTRTILLSGEINKDLAE